MRYTRSLQGASAYELETFGLLYYNRAFWVSLFKIKFWDGAGKGILAPIYRYMLVRARMSERKVEVQRFGLKTQVAYFGK